MSERVNIDSTTFGIPPFSSVSSDVQANRSNCQSSSGRRKTQMHSLQLLQQRAGSHACLEQHQQRPQVPACHQGSRSLHKDGHQEDQLEWQTAKQSQQQLQAGMPVASPMNLVVCLDFLHLLCSCPSTQEFPGFRLEGVSHCVTHFEDIGAFKASDPPFNCMSKGFACYQSTNSTGMVGGQVWMQTRAMIWIVRRSVRLRHLSRP